MEKSMKVRVVSRVFSEDYTRVNNGILDPGGAAIRRWSKVFLAVCLVSLFIDPLFFLVPVVQQDVCTDIGTSLQVTLTVIRSAADVFYIIQILVQFRTAYVAPSSRVFGRGELIVDPKKIALRYLRKGFWIELFVALPLPQVLVWVIIPNLRDWTIIYTNNVSRLIIFFQFIPRILLISPPSSQIVKATGIETKAPWAGAAFNMMLFFLSSHVLGGGWFLQVIERLEACWMSACDLDPSCQDGFFNCDMVNDPTRAAWFQANNVTTLCVPSDGFFNFGMYSDGVANAVVFTPYFFDKYFYCFWWGLRNLSTFGQNLYTSNYVPEALYATLVGTLGLVLFALQIGNVQRYLLAITFRLEQWRIKRTDKEQWMRHRQLPPELRQSVRKYDQYKWFATRGVDEEALLEDLPLDLRRNIKRHLCLDLVRRVPLFDQMDEQMLDAICERLKPAWCIEGTCQMREGDPVREMLFIIRGHLDSYTTNSGRTGFFNSCSLAAGDFCGEELLTWALDLRSSLVLPSSTRTVRAVSEVEAFALKAEDLKFVALQFRRLNSKHLRHKFRFYSHQWRTWAACSIQVAWRRYKRRKNAVEVEGSDIGIAIEPDLPSPGSGWAMFYAAKLAVRRESFRKGANPHAGLESPEPDLFM